jgi:hypothetical protein
MPEAAIHEHRYALRREHEVSLSTQAGYRGNVKSVAKAEAVKLAA